MITTPIITDKKFDTSLLTESCQNAFHKGMMIREKRGIRKLSIYLYMSYRVSSFRLAFSFRGELDLFHMISS